jgi:hypothetical protein
MDILYYIQYGYTKLKKKKKSLKNWSVTLGSYWHKDKKDMKPLHALRKINLKCFHEMTDKIKCASSESINGQVFNKFLDLEVSNLSALSKNDSSLPNTVIQEASLLSFLRMPFHSRIKNYEPCFDTGNL